MADHTLKGNNDGPCPACALRREELARGLARYHGLESWAGPVSCPCNACGGTGLVALSDAEIIRRSVEWARLHYWPEVKARWARLTGRTGE